MKKFVALAATLFCLLALAGCGSVPSADVPDTPEVSKLDAIPFTDGQLYAVAYLGYGEMENLTYYAENYLDSENLPIHYISNGEYYLIIPRYTDMALRLYQNDGESAERILIYEERESRPFVIQCNMSDIFSDVTIQLTYQSETVEFTPCISLENGLVQAGERGLDMTQNQP